MTSVIQLIGYADGGSSPYDGQYLVDANIETGGMVADVTTTTDITKALRFDDFSAAIGYWNRQASGRRIRPDGKPNRPLTAFTIQITKAPEGGTHADSPAGHTSG